MKHILKIYSIYTLYLLFSAVIMAGLLLIMGKFDLVAFIKSIGLGYLTILFIITVVILYMKYVEGEDFKTY